MSAFMILRQLFNRYLTFKVYDLSAQMAYYFLLSVFPFLVAIYSLLPYLPLNEDYILELVQPFAPEATYRLIENTISYFLVHQKQNLLSYSFITSVWLASMGFQSMKRILNIAYNIETKKSLFKQAIEGVLLTIGFMIVILFSVIIPVIERMIRDYLDDVFTVQSFQSFWTFFQWGIGSVFIVIFLIGLYYFSPNVKLKVKNVLPGAIFATIGWQFVSLQFASFVSFNNYSAFYGQLGGIVVLMLWFYLSAMIIIVGGLLNTIISPIDR